MVKIPPDWKYLRNLMDLIYLADINLLSCQRIYKEISTKNGKKFEAKDFLLLSANNAFYESIEILHTLLCSVKKEELRIEPLLLEEIQKNKTSIPNISDNKVNQYKKAIIRDYPSPDYLSYTFLSENDPRPIGNIMTDIKKKDSVINGINNLKRIKDNFEKYDFHKIRHQSAAHKNKALDAPAGAADLLIREDLLSKLADIVKDLKINGHIWFNYEVRNPYGFILESLEKSLV